MNNSSPLDEMSKCNSLTPAGRHEADWAGFEKLIPPEDKTFSARCMLTHVFQCPVVLQVCLFLSSRRRIFRTEHVLLLAASAQIGA